MAKSNNRFESDKTCSIYAIKGIYGQLVQFQYLY